MSMTQTVNANFDSDLESILPRLRVQALSLTHNTDRADDLVQQTALKALAGRKSFRTGTNFAGWMFRIQRNEFISELRRARPTICIDDPVVAQTKSHPPLQENGLIMGDFMAAFRQQSEAIRQALLLATVEGQPYAQIAKRAGITVGAIKSRIRRGRETLTRLLEPQVTSDRDTRPKHTSRRPIQCLLS
jgi:RNA polymerase sigma-70 factor (ECF subfamily)